VLARGNQTGSTCIVRPCFFSVHLSPDQPGDFIEALINKDGNSAGQGKVLLALLKNPGVPVVFLLLGAQLPLGRQEVAGCRQILIGELLTFTLELQRACLLPPLKLFDPPHHE
jgi:hypothetical protein